MDVAKLNIEKKKFDDQTNIFFLRIILEYG